jgi:hypothetical protein
MSDAPSLVRHVRPADAGLIEEWRWLVPDTLTPLFITAFGDWTFGAPDGSLWLLETLEGSLNPIAENSTEYNERKASEAWLDENLMAGWFVIALGDGLAPSSDECIGWKIHPLLGGASIKPTRSDGYSAGSVDAYVTILSFRSGQGGERAYMAPF